MRCKERVRNNSEDYPNYRECLEQAKNILGNAYNVSFVLSDENTSVK
jgi:hypothetical protein